MSATIDISGLTKIFGDGRGGGPRLRPGRPAMSAGRVRLAARPVGLRQVDPDADDRRPARADARRRSRVDGEPVTGPQTDIGIMFQDNTLVPWRTVRGNVDAAARAARARRRCLCRAHRATCSRSVRLDGFADALPVRAFRRHAAARRLLPGDGARARHAAARRAARQARRHDPREHPRRPAGAVADASARPWSSSPTRSRRRCSCRAASA